jgi:hypothetical protein
LGRKNKGFLQNRITSRHFHAVFPHLNKKFLLSLKLTSGSVYSRNQVTVAAFAALCCKGQCSRRKERKKERKNLSLRVL